MSNMSIKAAHSLLFIGILFSGGLCLPSNPSPPNGTFTAPTIQNVSSVTSWKYVDSLPAPTSGPVAPSIPPAVVHEPSHQLTSNTTTLPSASSATQASSGKRSVDTVTKDQPGNRTKSLPCTSRTNGKKDCHPSSNDTRAGHEHDLVPLGAVMHLFPRYGYLTLSMRVVQRNDSLSWIFFEPVKRVVDLSTVIVEEKNYSSSNGHIPMQRQFHLDFCNDTTQLLQAYFSKFRIDGLEKAAMAFAGGWRAPSISKYMGIAPNYVVGDYRYLLVKVYMVHLSGRVTLLPNITYSSEWNKQFDSVQPQNERSATQFFNDIGTHFTSSFLAGNALYQVFVFDSKGYDEIQTYLNHKNKNGADDMENLPALVNQLAKHIGKVFLLNGKEKIRELVQTLLTAPYKGNNITSIFNLHNNTQLFTKLEKDLQGEPSGLLGLELLSLDLLFPHGPKRLWIKESLQNALKLWEVNFH